MMKRMTIEHGKDDGGGDDIRDDNDDDEWRLEDDDDDAEVWNKHLPTPITPTPLLY
jgi:hypothetical protein